MFYHPVVLEEGDVIDNGLDSKNQTELIVHLDGNRTHAVFDPSSLDSGVEGVAHLAFILVVKFSSKESCNVFRLDAMDGGAGQMGIDGLEILLVFEDDIGCILCLHNAPVIAQIELFDDRAEPLCKKIKLGVKLLHFKGITEALSSAEIRYFAKGVVQEPMGDTRLHQAQLQPAMSVEVDLKAKRTPSGNTDIAKAEFFIDKVEVIV